MQYIYIYIYIYIYHIYIYNIHMHIYIYKDAQECTCLQSLSKLHTLFGSVGSP